MQQKLGEPYVMIGYIPRGPNVRELHATKLEEHRHKVGWDIAHTVVNLVERGGSVLPAAVPLCALCSKGFDNLPADEIRGPVVVMNHK